MFCRNCGRALEPSDRFCPNCGLDRDGDPSAPDAPARTAPGTSLWSSAPAPPADASAGGLPRYPVTAPGVAGGPPSERWDAAPGAPLAAFGAPLATWWQRVGAMLLDLICVGIPSGVVLIVLSSRFGTVHDVTTSSGAVVSTKSLPLAAELAYGLVVQGLYFALSYASRNGQTPGSHAPGIAVRDAETGGRIGLGRGFLRFLVRFVLYSAFVIPGLVNDLSPLWDARRQSFADKAARTVVVRA